MKRFRKLGKFKIYIREKQKGSEVFCKTDVSKYFAKFKGKGPRPATLLRRDFKASVFYEYCENFNISLTEHLRTTASVLKARRQRDTVK